MAYRKLEVNDRVRITATSAYNGNYHGRDGVVLETLEHAANVRFYDRRGQTGSYKELWFYQRNLVILADTPIKDPVPQVKEKEMTPVQQAGFKIGDKFRVHTDGDGFKVGTIIMLDRDDGSNYPMFKGQNDRYRLAGPNCNESGAYMRLDYLTKVDNSTPLTDASQPEVKRFKSGDKVKVTRIRGDGFFRSALGKIGTISHTDQSSLPALVHFEDGTADWGRFDELEYAIEHKRRKYKAGDLVYIRGLESTHKGVFKEYRNGKTVGVDDHIEYCYITLPSGKENGGWFEDNVLPQNIQKPTEGVIQMPVPTTTFKGFKIGDEVKVIRDDGFEYENINRVGTITRIDEHDQDLPIKVTFDEDCDMDWGRASGLELVSKDTNATVQEKLEAIKKLVAEVEAILYK